MPADRVREKGLDRLLCRRVRNIERIGLTARRHIGQRPIRRRAYVAIQTRFEQRSGRELAEAPIDTHGRGHVAVAKKRRQSVAIDLPLPGRKSGERLEFGGEYQGVAEASPIERFDTEAVARKRERAGRAIPRSEGKHAGRSLDRGAHAPSGEPLDHHFGVRVAAKRVACLLEFRAQLWRVVDLAVVA